MRRRGGVLWCAGLIACGAAAALVPQPATAAFPGANGRIVFLSDRHGNDEIHSVLPDGSGEQRLTATPQNESDPAISPDGSRIAFTRAQDVWVMNADGTGPVKLTGTEGSGDAGAAWSPDGTRIAFVSNRNTPTGYTTGPEIWVMNADASNARQLTETPSAAAHAPAWSPDGSRIAFHSNSDGEHEIYVIDAASTPSANGDARVKLTSNNFQDVAANWAPNGARIVFERGNGTHVGDATKELWTMNADGSDQVRLTTNTSYDVEPAWSPDGAQIAFTSNRDGDLELLSMPATAGAPAAPITSTVAGVDDRQPDWGTAGGSSPPPPPPPPPGPPPPPPPPGPGTPVPDPTPACGQKAGFQTLEAVGCFTKEGDLWRASGTVRLNGITLLPQAGAKLTIDPKGREIRSGTGVFAVVFGGATLYRGVLNWRPGFVGGVLAIALGAPSGTQVGKMPFTGPVELTFPRLGRSLVRAVTELPFLRALIAACGRLCPQVTGSLTMEGDNLKGLEADGVKIRVKTAAIGAVRIEDLQMVLAPAAGRWEGHSQLLVMTPAPLRIRAEWRVANGALERASARLEQLTSPLANLVAVRRLDLALRTAPAELSGSITLTAGPRVLGRTPLSIDGSFRFPLAGARGGTLRADGSMQVMDVPVSSAYLELSPGGTTDFGGRLQLGLPNVTAADPRRQPLFVGAALDGWVARNGFNADASAEVLLYGQRLASGSVVLSSVGFAACGQLGWLRGGFGRRWREPGPSVLGGTCDLAPYRASGTGKARAAQAGPVNVDLPDAERGAALRIRGTGGAPQVTIAGPGGRRVTTPADGTPLVNGDFVVLQDPAGEVTHVFVRRPAGAWTVTPAAGGPAIAGIDTAGVLARPRVTARVGGRGAARTLSWSLARRPGQQVTFAEQGRDSARVIARTTRSSGRVRFTPAAGRGRARTIVAIVEQDGIPREQRTVARYQAPASRPPSQPRGLRARRSGTTLVVSWRPARGAARYFVAARAADGDRELFVVSGRSRSLRIADIQRRDRATVEVTAVGADGRRGPTSRLTVRAAR